jgi:flagellar assembly factor FliW
MPTLQTKNFGPIRYDADAALAFPRGMPGFEERRRFLALHFDGTDPLVYLQSVEDPELCFLTIPVLVADRSYRLRVEEEDAESIGLTSKEPRIGEDVLCLAVLSLREDGPTANLLAPIVVNLRNRQSVQAVAPQSGYSHQHRLMAEEAVTC